MQCLRKDLEKESKAIDNLEEGLELKKLESWRNKCCEHLDDESLVNDNVDNNDIIICSEKDKEERQRKIFWKRNNKTEVW